MERFHCKLASLFLSAANQPIPYAIDNAYWSKMPKLINVTKERASLGITLVTREVSIPLGH